MFKGGIFMRTKLKPFENYRTNYIATFKKYGKNIVSGRLYKTALLTDIKNTFGDYVSDHIWIRDLKEINKLNLKENDTIIFSAVVKKYQHGYVRNYVGENESMCDYCLTYLKNTRKLPSRV